MLILQPSIFHGNMGSLETHLDAVRQTGTEDVGGEQCDVIEVSYMQGQRSKYYWLAQSDHLPRKLREVVRVATGADAERRRHVVHAGAGGAGLKGLSHPLVVPGAGDDDDLRAGELPEVGRDGLEDVRRGPRRDDCPHRPGRAGDAPGEVGQGGDRRDDDRASRPGGPVPPAAAGKRGEERRGKGDRPEDTARHAGTDPA